MTLSGIGAYPVAWPPPRSVTTGRVHAYHARTQTSAREAVAFVLVACESCGVIGAPFFS